MVSPAAPPPLGSHVNLEHPSEVTGLAAGVWVSAVGIVISTVLLAIRMFTKSVLVRRFGLDDVCIVLAWLFTTGVQGTFIYLRLNRGIGVHLWELTIVDANLSVLLLVVTSILYVLLMAFAKSSLLLEYRRLSSNRWYKFLIWITLGIIISYSIAFIFTILFACTPMGKNWDITIAGGKCINKGVIHLATAAANAATDLVMLILPIPTLLHLQLPKIQKVGLLCIFIIGLLTLATCCVRTALLPSTITSHDVTWVASTPTMLLSVEASLIIVCGCLPILRLFFQHVAPQLIGELPRRRSIEDGNQSGFTSRIRPISELTTFKGRVMRKQTWERMHTRESSHNMVHIDNYRDDSFLSQALPQSPCFPQKALTVDIDDSQLQQSEEHRESTRSDRSI